MNVFSAIVILTATVVGAPAEEPLDYTSAYKLAMKGDKPLLVLVTAEWCPPCQILKNDVLPKLLKQDAFADYHFATVDFDEQNDLAKKLVGNRGLPQLLIYERQVNDKWGMRFLSGAKSYDVVHQFLVSPGNRVQTAKANVGGATK